MRNNFLRGEKKPRDGVVSGKNYRLAMPRLKRLLQCVSAQKELTPAIRTRVYIQYIRELKINRAPPGVRLIAAGPRRSVSTCPNN